MSYRKSLASLALTLLVTAASTAVVDAADHLDAPALSGRGDVDVNDLFAFQSPTNPNNTVLIMTVNPGAGAISGTTFSSTDIYQFQIDNDGDALADVTYATTFGAPAGPRSRQSFSVERNGSSYASGTSGPTNIATSSGGLVRSGKFEDPFFFDLNGFNNGFSFTGDDFFAGLDVTAIVLEVPSSELGGPNVGIWARTVDSVGTQIDRMGRPAINTALIDSSRKDDFNDGVPADDPANFGAEVQAAIESLNGGDSSHAATLTGILLPDVLTFDTSSSSGFLNGRQLADDVIDAELDLLTKGALPTDMVDANDVLFRTAFPYLAAPNVPEPTALVLAALGLPALATRRRRD